MGVIKKVRAPIDKALDALIEWIVTMAKKLFAKAFGQKDLKDARSDAQKNTDLNAAVAEATKHLERSSTPRTSTNNSAASRRSTS